MKKSSTHQKPENIDLFVGLDVHKATIDVATADEGRTAEVRHYGKIAGDLSSLDKVIHKLHSTGRTLPSRLRSWSLWLCHLSTSDCQADRLHRDRTVDDPEEERRAGQD